MPNYISNRVTIVGNEESVKKVVEFVKGEDGAFEFNKVIPMPESLDIDSNSDGKTAMEYLSRENGKWVDAGSVMKDWSDERRKAALHLGAEYLDNLIKYGSPTWYEWRITHWGTKWNAVGAKYCGEGLFMFDTAWNFPEPVLRKLSELFPEVEIDFIYADEDYGYNTGRGTIKNGEIEAYYPEGGSDDAMALYFETHEWAREEMHQDENGDWVWND